MITETQTRVIVLQLSDELLAQLQPFLAGLDIATTAHGEGAYQKVEQHQQRLTMRSEVYIEIDALPDRAINEAHRQAGMPSLY